MILPIPLADESQSGLAEGLLEVISELEQIEAAMDRKGLYEASESLSTVIRDLRWQTEEMS